MDSGKSFKRSAKHYFRKMNPSFACSKYINKIALIWMPLIYKFVQLERKQAPVYFDPI